MQTLCTASIVTLIQLIMLTFNVAKYCSKQIDLGHGLQQVGYQGSDAAAEHVHMMQALGSGPG